jgi:hypothetical protein
MARKSPSSRKKSTAIVPHQSNFNIHEGTLAEVSADGKATNFPYNISDEPNPFESAKDFHVDHLKSVLIDVARPNLFKIKIVPPDALSGDWDSSKSGLMALAKSAKIPSMTVKEWTYERAGQKLHIPNGEVEHGDVSITFINDSKFIIRSMFNRWMRLGLMNYEYNIGAVPTIALQGQVVIYQYDYNLNPVYMVKLINAWPSMLSEIDLSQDSENTAEEFTVEFKYSYQEIYKNFNEDEN